MKKLALFIFLLQFSLQTSAQWLGIPFPNLETGLSPAYPLWIDSSTFYAIDRVGHVYMSLNFGESIIEKQLPIKHVGGFQQITKSTGYILESFGDKIYKTTNSWESYQELLITNDGDTAFKNNQIWGFVFWSETKGMVFGDSTNGCMEIWTNAENDTVWERVACTSEISHHTSYFASASQPVPTIKFENGQAYVCLTSYYGYFRISDFGRKWKKYLYDDHWEFYEKIAFKDSLHGISARRTYFPKDGRTSIARTEDGGATWDTSLLVPFPFDAIEYAKPSSNYPGYYVACGEKCYISLNDGQTWTQIDSFPKKYISFWNSETGMFLVENDGNGVGGYLFDPSFLPDPNGILSPSKIDIKLYPNPCHKHLTVIYSGPSTTALLFGIDGKIYASWRLENGENEFELHVPAGVYFVRNEDGGFCEKVVVME